MRISILLIMILLSSCTYNEIVPVCEPDDQIFSDLVQPIIEANCIGCHNESNGSSTILTTYDFVIDAVYNHSLRYQVISGEMPPYGSSPLSISEINIIENWLDCE